MLEYVLDAFRDSLISVKKREEKRPWWLSTLVLYTGMILLGVYGGFTDIPVFKAAGLFVFLNALVYRRC